MDIPHLITFLSLFVSRYHAVEEYNRVKAIRQILNHSKKNRKLIFYVKNKIYGIMCLMVVNCTMYLSFKTVM